NANASERRNFQRNSDVDSKRSGEAIRQSEDKYRFVVENANEAILVAQDGILKFANSRAAKISKYTVEELTSKPFIDFVHVDDKEKVGEIYRQGLSDNEAPHLYSFRIMDKIGMAKWLEINAVTIIWDGRPAILIFANDVSARRQMEEELLRIEKLESLGILAGGIAHDFNNILTAILGNISLASLYSNSEEKMAKRLKEAEKACLRAQGLTIQLLTFAKGGAPVKKTASIGDIIRDAALFSLRGSNVRPEFSIADDLWTVEVDEAQISQVTNNLIINADHAMPEGGVVQVSAENVRVTRELGLPLETGQYVKFTIKDHGVGIPDQIITRIFDPYFTTKRMGSGLGLATSYSIIRNHGGIVTVESEANLGTTFHIYLPASQQQINVVSESEFDSFSTGRGRILIMDDEAIIRELSTELLSHLGYDVEVAEDGSRAVDLYASALNSANPFDLVILDLTVPGGMGGRETIQRLSEIHPGVLAIVSSGYANDPIITDYVSHGFKGVISKPYTIKEISETLNRVIGGGNA
ncbi:MAG: PAS domain S-box protein, partial [Desulfomonile tiedjei]|nr:PAS domain S-box protein [Desulfomonile tiedjei]